MMKRTYTLFSLLFILLFSCGNESEDQQDVFRVIPVNPNADDELSLRDIADEIEAVKLEETDESLIAMTTKVERTEDYIFIFDFSQQKIFQFDDSGKFLQLIGKIGGGPEEVERPVGFSLDRMNGHIYIIGMRKIVVYDYNGDFVRYIRDYSFPNYTYFMNDTLEVFRTETKNLEGGGFLKFPTRYRVDPSTGGRIDSLELTKVSLKNQMMFIMTDANYYSESTDKTYFYLPVLFPEPFVRDTIYEARSSVFEPSLKLDFGESAVSETGNKAVNIRSFFRSDRYLIVRYSYEGKAKLLIYDLEEYMSYNLDAGLDGGEHSDGEPVLITPLPAESNTYCFSAKILEGGSTEEPNPTLYFVKLKN